MRRVVDGRVDERGNREGMYRRGLYFHGDVGYFIVDRNKAGVPS